MRKSILLKASVFGIILMFVGAGAVASVDIKDAKQLKSLVTESKSDHITFNDTGYYALIIGVEEFEGMEYPESDCIDEDALSIYETLVSSINWDEENIKLLLNENATKENIHSAIEWLDEKETENDVVLFYFSGQGWKMPLLHIFKGNAYIVPYDNSDWNYDEHKISDVDLDGWLAELESDNIVVILDHCYSGKMKSLNSPGRKILAGGGQYVFCRCDEDDTLGHGIFTYFLLQGFNGVADINNDDWISDTEVFSYAKFPTFYFSFWQKFPFIQVSIPLINSPQLPYMYDNHPEEIPLINYPSSR